MDITTVFTYQDAIEHLIQYNGGAPDDYALARMKTSAQVAYNELCYSMEWMYYNKPYRITLSEPYETGTVAVSTAGVVTGSGTTFPTWAASGRLLINDIVYSVDTRDSNTQLTLKTQDFPATAIAAGTSYTLYRSVYTLPENFRKVKEFIGEDVWTANYMTPHEWLRRERYSNDTGTPWLWTIMQTTEKYGYGRLAVFFSGYPDETETFDFIYVANPRPIVFSGYEANSRVGTVAVAASTALTGTTTAFSAAMVGSIIRLTSGTDYPGGIHSFVPYDEQRVIAARASATGIALDQATTGTYSAKKYVVTDPLDFPMHMRTAYLRGCEKQLDLILPNAERYRQSSRAYTEALIEARERQQYAPVEAVDLALAGQRLKNQLGSDSV